jgi:hypothetical protein
MKNKSSKIIKVVIQRKQAITGLALSRVSFSNFVVVMSREPCLRRLFESNIWYFVTHNNQNEQSVSKPASRTSHTLYHRHLYLGG